VGVFSLVIVLILPVQSYLLKMSGERNSHAKKKGEKKKGDIHNY